MADENINNQGENEDKFAEVRKKYNLGGRPVVFKTPKSLLEKMYEFLQACEDRKIEVAGKDRILQIISPAPITVEDFCVFAGIGKNTFYDYGKKKGFEHIVAQFRQIVEAYFVRQLVEGRPGNKADFVLRNMNPDDWKEKTEMKLDGELAITPKDRAISEVNELIAKAAGGAADGNMADTVEE